MNPRGMSARLLMSLQIIFDGAIAERMGVRPLGARWAMLACAGAMLVRASSTPTGRTVGDARVRC